MPGVADGETFECKCVVCGCAPYRTSQSPLVGPVCGLVAAVSLAISSAVSSKSNSPTFSICDRARTGRRPFRPCCSPFRDRDRRPPAAHARAHAASAAAVRSASGGAACGRLASVGRRRMCPNRPSNPRGPSSGAPGCLAGPPTSARPARSGGGASALTASPSEEAGGGKCPAARASAATGSNHQRTGHHCDEHRTACMRRRRAAPVTWAPVLLCARPMDVTSSPSTSSLELQGPHREEKAWYATPLYDGCSAGLVGNGLPRPVARQVLDMASWGAPSTLFIAGAGRVRRVRARAARRRCLRTCRTC